MNDQVATIFTVFLLVLVFAVIGRALLSWFPSVDRNNPGVRLLHQITDPLLDPLRRVIPPVGGFDLTPIIVIFVLMMMVRVVAAAAEA